MIHIEDKHLLLNAIHEIKALRQTNEILMAQMAIVEVFAAALGLKKGSRGETIDIVYELQQKINKLEKENGQSSTNSL
jgi:uncharacterized protein YunC (DUF1805 family)